ncbi:oligopeptide ABC transporter substrate-binding protein [Pseudostreptobacillus hongkongensis]|uniref:oligopeptide ABC transporter substrate-binding protein n=1 Tax=Pseudostreptobacillus hongkongensis TaxID=1162717 RepID=UPI0028D15338|nr:oligopeptide ABC transporter substrate-binding protein [Pseudostreptobacillus hongkongensis]
MNKFIKASIMLGVLGMLISCGPGKSRSEKGGETTSLNFPMEYTSDQKAIEGGELKVALVTNSPFKGIFSPLHYQEAPDGDIMNYFNEEIFWKNDDFEIVGKEGGMATVTLDEKNKTINIKFREGLKWSDGAPLGVDDFIYTYEVLGSPDYTGVRYSPEDHGTIIGMKEYHEGKAKTISGFEKVSDTELKIHVSELSPKLITGGGALTSGGSILPKHYLSDVAIKDLASSDKVRKNPISNGKFVVKSIVPGESVELVPNENYYLGKPKLDKVIIKTLGTQLQATAMKNGEFHVYLELDQSLYEKFKDFDNLSLIGRPDLYYQYLGFNLGHYDKEKGVSVQDRKTPLQDVKVRQAMAYALNIDEIAQAFYGGIRQRANGVTPPVFKKYYNSSLEGYPYNPEKAKQLLAEAGYKDTDGDGIVDKDGKNLKLHFTTMNGSEVAEPIAQQMLQNWKEIGVDVELTNGRLLDFNLFYDKVQANDDDIDMYMAAWGVGSSLDPAQSKSKYVEFNITRYANDENERLINAISDPKGISDPNYKAEAYKKWEEYFVSQAVEVPLMFRYIVVPINKGIKYANVFIDDSKAIYDTQFVTPLPVKASN